MKEMTFEVGSKMRLNCLQSAPEITIEKLENGWVYYWYMDVQYCSPIDLIHGNADGWYVLEMHGAWEKTPQG